jgi:hypothetical protein
VASLTHLVRYLSENGGWSRKPIPFRILLSFMVLILCTGGLPGAGEMTNAGRTDERAPRIRGWYWPS